jgi:hypothetical protein
MDIMPAVTMEYNARQILPVIVPLTYPRSARPQIERIGMPGIWADWKPGLAEITLRIKHSNYKCKRGI